MTTDDEYFDRWAKETKNKEVAEHRAHYSDTDEYTMSHEMRLDLIHFVASAERERILKMIDKQIKIKSIVIEQLAYNKNEPYRELLIQLERKEKEKLEDLRAEIEKEG